MLEKKCHGYSKMEQLTALCWVLALASQYYAAPLGEERAKITTDAMTKPDTISVTRKTKNKQCKQKLIRLVKDEEACAKREQE